MGVQGSGVRRFGVARVSGILGFHAFVVCFGG